MNEFSDDPVIVGIRELRQKAEEAERRAVDAEMRLHQIQVIYRRWDEGEYGIGQESAVQAMVQIDGVLSEA